MLGNRVILFALITASSLQSGCARMRAIDDASVTVDSVAYQSVTISPDTTTSIAGILLIKKVEKDGPRYSIKDSGPEVEAIKNGIRDGLVMANPNLHPIVLKTIPVSTICSLDISENKMTSATNVQSCHLPSELSSRTNADLSFGSQPHLLLLVLAETELIKGDVDVGVGVGAGAGGAAPLVVGGKTDNYKFSLLARTYNRQTGQILAEASTTISAQANYGFLMFLPMNIDIPDETKNYSVMSRSVGLKLGQSLQINLK